MNSDGAITLYQKKDLLREQFKELKKKLFALLSKR